jgi:hypothetical protein
LQINQQTIAGKIATRKAALTGGLRILAQLSLDPKLARDWLTAETASIQAKEGSDEPRQ